MPIRFPLSICRSAAAVVVGCCLHGAPALADDACDGFRAEFAPTRTQYAGDAQTLQAGSDVESAPTVRLGRPYALALSPLSGVKLAAAPGKPMLPDGAAGGMVRFEVPEAGGYHVAIGSNHWIDIVDSGKLIASRDFQGVFGCSAPHKVVVYELPAGRELVLQFSGSPTDTTRLLIKAATP